MLFQKTTEYAIRIFAFMAKGGREVYSAKLLHEELNLPYKYITRLMTDLSKKGFISVTKGRNGGFSIAKNIQDIKLKDIIFAVESESDFGRCILGFDSCSDDKPCCLHEQWVGPKESLMRMVEDVDFSKVISTNANANIIY